MGMQPGIRLEFDLGHFLLKQKSLPRALLPSGAREENDEASHDSGLLYFGIASEPETALGRRISLLCGGW